MIVEWVAGGEHWRVSGWLGKESIGGLSCWLGGGSVRG